MRSLVRWAFSERYKGDAPLVRDITHPPKITHSTPLPIHTMKPPSRNRTTSAPGLVDLPTPRRSSKEVVLEKKKKNDAATAKAEAKRLAAAQVADLENQPIAGPNKGTRTNQLGPKRPKKRPAMSAGIEVSSFRSLIR